VRHMFSVYLGRRLKHPLNHTPRALHTACQQPGAGRPGRGSPELIKPCPVLLGMELFSFLIHQKGR